MEAGLHMVHGDLVQPPVVKESSKELEPAPIQHLLVEGQSARVAQVMCGLVVPGSVQVSFSLFLIISQ